MKPGLLIAFVLLFLLSCRMGREVYYQNGNKYVVCYREFPRYSTSYTRTAHMLVYDSITGKKNAKIRYRKKVSCFGSHYVRYTTVRYDSAGRKIGKHHLSPEY